MEHGTAGIIGCPVLGDELVYSLMKDTDSKNIYVVNSKSARSFIERLNINNVRYTLIDEQDFEHGCDGIDRTKGFNVVIYMNRLGLHADPKILRETIQDQIKLYNGRFDVLALYYGMCGNGGWDPSVWAANESIGTPVLVFRDENGNVCDDCIAVAVGGPAQYLDLLRKYTGMLFITPALATDWEEYEEELNFLKGFDAMGITTLPDVFGVYGYKHSVKLDTGIGKRADLENDFKRVEIRTGLEMIASDTDLTDLAPAERLYAELKDTLNKHA